ncbi:valine--tRNA ligase [Chloroflexota bacterium]
MTQTPNIEQDMPKVYEPSKVEQKWYQFWLEKGYFSPEIDLKKKPFVIIMPPPNVTGELHIGHALTATLEDIMARWHRMKGEPTLWLPGVDHAGIATQVVVEQQLAREGLDRFQLGRKNFLERVWQWAEKCHSRIVQQHQRLGISCDWNRECFTLDEKPNRAVRTAFVRLYDKGLVYRGERIINWCPRCATALSDLEVEHKDLTGHLYHIRYHLADDTENYITVATTRPETILGDTAVAVNPGDKRFKSIVGRKVILPEVNREIPIIADEVVDPNFGTGAVKITPAHDPVDFEIAQRHQIALINILNPNATMNENAGPYAGLDRFACRKAILSDLEKAALLAKIEPYGHSVGHCARCQTIVEPIASKQWFITTAPLAQPAIKAVADGRITIIPQRFTKVYLNWMENIRDWCISRQLWWGHQIPVWYCHDCGEVTVAIEDATICCHCHSSLIEQDPDVLDTWFSSALWPHSTLGWPNDTTDLRYFYPTTVMETGYDILFFWVARMIMMGLEDTGDIPFRTVYLHGLIRDEKGDKMSKIRGNVLNPLDTLETYGTDALRLTLSSGTSPGNDIKLALSKLEASRNFANKLWNATRFVVRSMLPKEEFISAWNNYKFSPETLPIEDRWILSRLNRNISSVTTMMAEFQFGEAQRQIHDFLWGEFCDWYIEFAKIRLHSANHEAPSPLPILVNVLETSLRLLHPYMPFITEELWQNLKKHLPPDRQVTESIMVATYPMPDEAAIDPESELVMESIIEMIHAIRNARAQHKIESTRWIEARIYAGKLISTISLYSETIQALARVKPIMFIDSHQKTPPGEKALVLVLKEFKVVLPLASIINLEADKNRRKKEIEHGQTQVTQLQNRLNDKTFLNKAPKVIVNKERQRLSSLIDKLEKLKQQNPTL